MSPKYSLMKKGDGFVVNEFLRGKNNTISLDDYVAQGNDVSELFKKYLVENPSYGDQLRFEDSKPGFCKVTDGNVVFDEISMKDIKVKVDGNEKFMDSIDYSDILINTKEYEDRKKAEKEEVQIGNQVAKVKEALSDKNFLQKHKGLAAIVAGAALIGSIGIGYLVMPNSEDTGYDNKAYTDGTMDRKLKGMNASLVEFKDKYKNDPTLAMLEVDEILWFNKQVDKEKLSQEQRLELEKLVEMAEKIKEERK